MYTLPPERAYNAPGPSLIPFTQQGIVNPLLI